MRLLLDVNVVLDILLDRQPHVLASSAVWTRIETGREEGRIPAHGITTIHYLVQRERGAERADDSVKAILSVLGVAAVDDAVIRRAVELGWPDFEDAVCAASAVSAGCDVLVTRDPDGFPDPPLPVMDPESAVAWLSSSSL